MDKIGLIDFKGQRDAHLYTHVLLYASAVASFFLGLLAQNFKLAIGAFLTGVLATFVIVVPPWPFYNTQPDSWLENESKKAYAEAVRKLQEELDGEKQS